MTDNGSFSSGHVAEPLDEISMENQFAREKRSDSHILGDDSRTLVGDAQAKDLSPLTEPDQFSKTDAPSEMKLSQERVE